eukprot:1234114-Prymnesium_polylepis.1
MPICTIQLCCSASLADMRRVGSTQSNREMKSCRERGQGRSAARRARKLSGGASARFSSAPTAQGCVCALQRSRVPAAAGLATAMGAVRARSLAAMGGVGR